MNFEAFCKTSLAVIAKRRSALDAPHRPSSYVGTLEMKYGTNALLNAGASNFFLGILRSFSMTKSERKDMEAASRYFGVRSKTFKLPSEGWEPKYIEHWAKLERMFVTACKIVARGEACSDDQYCTARCFRLVNTGGFDLKTMQTVQAIVDRAAKIIDEAGFKELCYGDVYVTNTVMRDSNILAFYMQGDDRMYVRANLKNVESSALHTIIHELGHRLDHKFVGADGRTFVTKLYREYQRADLDRPSGVEGGSMAKVGDIFVHKNETFRVVRVADKVYLRGVDPEIQNVQLSMGILAWQVRHGGKASARQPSAFPTPYSATKSSEFFAEMFTFALLDKLTKKQRDDFDPILEDIAAKLGDKKPGMSRGRAKRR